MTNQPQFITTFFFIYLLLQHICFKIFLTDQNSLPLINLCLLYLNKATACERFISLYTKDSVHISDTWQQTLQTNFKSTPLYLSKAKHLTYPVYHAVGYYLLNLKRHLYWPQSWWNGQPSIVVPYLTSYTSSSHNSRIKTVLFYSYLFFSS